MRGRRTTVPEALRTGPFTVAEARRHGVMLDQLRDRRVFRRLLHGVYACRELPPTRNLWIDAAAKVLPPDAVFSHRTAALLWGIPVADDDLIHVTVTRSSTCPRFRRIRVHQTNEELPCTCVDGRRLTPPERTFTDLATELALVDLVVAGDRMLADGVVEHAALRQQIEAGSRRRGTRLARSAAELMRPGVRSGAETRLRLLLVLSGLPTPWVNTSVILAGGALRFTPALHYPQARLALEPDPRCPDDAALPATLPGPDTDAAPGHALAEHGAYAENGVAHHGSEWWRDRNLLRRITDRGWTLVGCDSTDLWRTGWSTVRDIHAALRQRRQPGTPETINRTKVQGAIGTLMDASEVAWTRVPRRSTDHGFPHPDGLAGLIGSGSEPAAP